jgi:CheY-like chemotaxis protein
MAATARVLVVDDNDGIRELVSDVLSWAGHETATAHDGVDALEVLQRWSPDVIVLDAMMPRMDGLQFARTYRDLPGPHAPIIALTAAHDGPRRAAEMQAAGFVRKPFSADELLRLVVRYAGACASA